MARRKPFPTTPPIAAPRFWVADRGNCAFLSWVVAVPSRSPHRNAKCYQLRHSAAGFALLPPLFHAIIFWQGSPPGLPPYRRRLPIQLADEQRLHAPRGCLSRIAFGSLGTRPTKPPGTRSLACRP